jgi:hypothetical protein
MNDLRLERALRDGPPFGTQYADRALPLDQAPAAPVAVLRQRPMALLLLAVAMLLVALTTALIVGALRSSALGFNCEDLAGALSRDANGWPVDASPVPAGAAKAGMLAASDQAGRVAVLDPTTGEPCGSLDFAAGMPVDVPTWSPGGDAAAMLVGPENHRATALVVVSADGVMERVLEPWPLNLTWSPDGRAIAVVSASEMPFAQPAGVWIVPHDGSAPRQMTFDCDSCVEAEGGVLGWATDAVWSPDSRQIALGFNPADRPDAIRDDGRERYWVGSVDSGRLAEVTGVPSLDLSGWQDADSLLMADRTESDRWFDVPVAHPEDAVAVPRPESKAPLSPDGRYRLADSSGSQLAIMDVDGGRRRVLADEPGIRYFVTAWAPDSQSLAFTKYTDTTGNPIDGIWVVDLNGAVRLLNVDYRIAGPWQPARE